jgi:hypothetical protein
MMYLVTGFHLERRQDLWHPENVHVQDGAGIDQFLYAKPDIIQQIIEVRKSINQTSDFNTFKILNLLVCIIQTFFGNIKNWHGQLVFFFFIT